MINAIVPWGEVHVPNGFGLSDEGLFAYDKKTKDYGYVCPPLAFVSGTSSLSDGSETYDLQYVTSRGDVVVREVRAAELTSRDIESWVGFGIGVTPTNKVPLLRFLVAQRRCIDIKVTYATVGWLNDDEFAANQLISSDPQRAGSLDSGSYDLQPKGTAHEWWKMWSGIRQNAALQLAVAVGLSSVLLRPISQAYPDLRNLLVSFIGNSSTGKTTAAMLAVSVAGNTQPFSQGSLMRSWSATPTAIPIMLDGNHGVPFVLDELSRFKGRDLTDVLYNLAEGTSRVRATKIATLRETSSWQTTIVVTGEHGLLDGTVSAQNDGLRTRVIELESVQWTSSSEEAEFIKTNCSNAYGWLITDLVKWVIFHREELLETFEAAVLMAKRLMADAPYRDRLSIKYAVLGATAVAANKCWPEIGLDAEKIMELAI
ncbi:DUF927 domain-containing protein [Levilactobacillus brevis]|uniref:DUF927 domain-containing protein n=1 Tax=Levilactobacillus brevis TaxID=1580 RepID=UPI001BDEE8B6|nr:DUF927 domain-containing protein [Levilactobacillus brevis]